MKVSLKWLSKYVDISDISPEELASKLTFAGIEVEEVQHLASGTNLVIGQIIECENHPDSNHLHILKVDCGSKIGIKQIVCGAPNARKGLKVIVAQEGAVLPQITITRGSIRGVESCGMCCALFELGVDKKYLTDAQINGIEELPEDAEVGNENVLEYLGLDDVVLDLKLLANRSDCNSLLNVAKEVGALYSRPVRLPKPTLVETTPVDFTVSSETDKCPLFYAKVMKNVKIGPSPKWLQDSLVAMGVRSINSIVDIGNYIMLLTGQPLHMYDLDKLTSASLVARDDYEGDFVALDEQTYKVLKGDLVICNDGKPMCLGGVMGSLACAVDENTKNIVIEAAYFNAASIRKTSIRLNLISESSSRFVKGINPHQHEYVLNLAAQCVRELCDCHDESAIIKYDVMNHDLLKIPFTCEKINNRLGTTFTDEQILDVLKQVGIEINKCESGLEAIIPAHRIDMTCVADLSEEVIRILGFDNITSQLPTLKTIVGGLNEKQLKKRQVRDYLCANGLFESLTYTLVRKEETHEFEYVNNDETYDLLHPMTDEHETVRKNVLPSLLKSVQYNISRQARDLALFEVSEINTKNRQETHLAIVLCGDDLYQHKMKKIPYSFYSIKGLFEGIMNLLGISSTRYKLERLVSDKKEFHPGRSCVVTQGKKVLGVFGEVHPNILKKYDLGKTSCQVLELNLTSFIEMKTSISKMVPPSKYPFVERDLALVVKKEVSAADIIKTIKIAGKDLVANVEIFDEYVGEHVEEGYKSLAIKITYQNKDKTLEEKELTNAESLIKEELFKVHNIILRG